MSLLLLLRGAVAWGTVPGNTNPTPPDLETGRIYIGQQIGGRSSKPLLLPFRGKCTGLETDEVYATPQIGGRSSKPLASPPTNLCDESGNFQVGVPMYGVQIGRKDGKPLLFATCERCGTCLCNKCGWGSYSAAPDTLELAVHSPTGGFDDFAITLGKLAANASLPPSTFTDIGQRCGDWSICRDFDPVDPNEPCALHVYYGEINEQWGAPISVSYTGCGSGSFISATANKLVGWAALVNYVYPVDGLLCNRWYLIVVIQPDTRDGATWKQYVLTGTTEEVEDTSANMSETCEDGNFILQASGVIECDSGEHAFATTTVPNGDTFELTVTL